MTPGSIVILRSLRWRHCSHWEWFITTCTLSKIQKKKKKVKVGEVKSLLYAFCVHKEGVSNISRRTSCVCLGHFFELLMMKEIVNKMSKMRKRSLDIVFSTPNNKLIIITPKYHLLLRSPPPPCACSVSASYITAWQINHKVVAQIVLTDGHLEPRRAQTTK